MHVESTPRAGRREWVGLAVLALPCLLYSMDLTVLHLAVPKLSADLEPTGAQLLWIIDVYGFFVAGSLITMGTLGDRIGRRRLLLIGAAAFGVASVLAAFSSSAEMLIVTRSLLGVAGATVAPSTLSLIRNMFLDPRQRTVAIGVWMTSFSVGGAVGPLVGGLLLEFYWWGSVFLIAVPIMALLLVVGPALLPEYRDPNAGRLDVVSAALSLVAMLAVIFGFKRMAQNGVSLTPALAIVAGAAVGLLFVRRQRRLEDPVIDLRLFRVPSFSASLATYGFGVLLSFGAFLFLPQYLQLVVGLSPLRAGVWTIPWTLAFVLGATLTPLLVRRMRPVDLIVGGLGIAALGFVVFTRVDADTSFATFATASFMYGLGFAPVFVLTTDLIVGSAPAERAGAASAVSETSAELGGALGIALFGSIGLALYRSAMLDALPSGVSPVTADAARATLGAAIALAEQLPADLGVGLAEAGRAAFLRGLRLCAALSVGGAAVLACFAAATLGRRAPARLPIASEPRRAG